MANWVHKDVILDMIIMNSAYLKWKSSHSFWSQTLSSVEPFFIKRSLVLILWVYWWRIWTVTGQILWDNMVGTLPFVESLWVTKSLLFVWWLWLCCCWINSVNRLSEFHSRYIRLISWQGYYFIYLFIYLVCEAFGTAATPGLLC
jgi:hypothetical protein